MIKIRKKHRQRLLVFLSDAIKAHSRFHFCKCQKEKSGEINNLKRCKVCFHEASISGELAFDCFIHSS